MPHGSTEIQLFMRKPIYESVKFGNILYSSLISRSFGHFGINYSDFFHFFEGPCSLFFREKKPFCIHFVASIAKTFLHRFQKPFCIDCKTRIHFKQLLWAILLNLASNWDFVCKYLRYFSESAH